MKHRIECFKKITNFFVYVLPFVGFPELLAKNNPTTKSAAPQILGATFVSSGNIIKDAPTAYKYVLKNGLTLLLLPDSRNPVATYRMILNAGSNQEVLGKTGLAHFFEHMMFRKTKNVAEGFYDRTLAGVGGSGNAGTSTDFVEYESIFPGPALDHILKMESDRFANLDLVDPYFSTEKGAVISERKLRYENDPSRRASEILRKIIDKNTPYEWLTIGDKNDVENMSIKDAQSFYDSLYRPDNAILMIGGPFEIKQTAEKVVHYFGSWKGASKFKKIDIPDSHYDSLAGKHFECSEAVMQQRYMIYYPSKTNSYVDSVYSWAFSQFLNDHPDGTMARRLQKKNLGSDFAFYKNSYQKGNPNVQVIFVFSPEQDKKPLVGFWKDSVDYVKSIKIDATKVKVLLKKQEVAEAEESSRMTSLAQSYEWNEFLYGDYLASKNAKDVISKITTKSMADWIAKNVNPAKSISAAVLAANKAPHCNTLKN